MFDILAANSSIPNIIILVVEQNDLWNESYKIKFHQHILANRKGEYGNVYE